MSCECLIKKYYFNKGSLSERSYFKRANPSLAIMYSLHLGTKIFFFIFCVALFFYTPCNDDYNTSKSVYVLLA